MIHGPPVFSIPGNQVGSASATVFGLRPGKTYKYAIYQYAEGGHVGSVNGLLVSGHAMPQTTMLKSDSPTAMGSAPASARHAAVSRLVLRQRPLLTP